VHRGVGEHATQPLDRTGCNDRFASVANAGADRLRVCIVPDVKI